jgi:hypothetical protein
MISMIQSLAIGNALRLFIQPPAGAVRWRLLRKGADNFSGVDDETALVAYEGNDLVVVDHQALPNEQMAFYRPFYADDQGAWIAGPTAHGTPAAIYADQCTDVLSIVRERLESGLKVEIQRGELQNELGYVQVFTSPPLMDTNIEFPCVSLHMESEAPGERAIGEDAFGDQFDAIGFGWDEAEGWLANVRLQIIGWSYNPDERLNLRKAIRRIIIGNLPVFASEGMQQVNLEQSDAEELTGAFGAPMFQVMNTFSCVAPVRVGSQVPAVRDVNVTQKGT